MPEKQPRKKTILPVVLLFLAVVIFLSYFLLRRTATSSDSKQINEGTGYSIAVLPFVNTDSAADRQYFSDGLSEGILNSLAHVNGLKVTARSSSFQFHNSADDIKEIGKKLGVHNVLKGSFQLQGDRIRINTQLINAEDGFGFWSAQYDENINDIFTLQDKIANAIVVKLGVALSRKASDMEVKRPAVAKEAYNLYLKGRAAWNQRTAASLQAAIGFFQQSIVLEPNFAAAYAGIADCYNALGYQSVIAPKDAFPNAFAAATKAAAIDPTFAEPHAALGFYKFYYDWDWAAAEQEFRTAIALNPNYPSGYDWYGYYLTSMERYDEARVVLEKAKELDPLSVQISTDIGFCIYYSGDYDLAISKLQAVVQKKTKFPLAHIWLGRSYQAKKMYAEAIGEYKSALAISPGWSLALAQAGNAYGVSGDKVAAEIIADSLQALSKKIFVTSYGMALVYAGLNQNDKTFVLLNKAYEERSNWLVWLKKDPRWIAIRADKRYNELVNKVGLPNNEKH